MEEGTFRVSAVAEILEERFVEARLHVDYKENLERQLDMVQSNAQPIYVVVDPATGEIHGEQFKGAALSDDEFIEWLNVGWDIARPGVSSVQTDGQ